MRTRERNNPTLLVNSGSKGVSLACRLNDVEGVLFREKEIKD